MKRILAVSVFVVLLHAVGVARGQGVGINATGAAADTSAILDLSSSAKGFLPPRMTAAQRAAIALPAKGLVVFQTDGTPGLYYNVGVPAVPNWKLLAEAGALAGGGLWQADGTTVYYDGGSVGIGTSTPPAPLSVIGGDDAMRVQTDNAGGTMASFGGNGTFEIDAPGVIAGRLSLLENGNLGLGVVEPTNKLSFAPVLGKKISLYPGATGDVGFGVAGNRLQIYSDNPSADVALGWDANGTFNERFAVKPNGALAVNGNTGAAGQILQSNGGGAAATWVDAGAAAYANTRFARTTSYAAMRQGFAPTAIPGLVVTFTASAAATVIVSGNVNLHMESPSGRPFVCEVKLVVDGAAVNSYWVSTSTALSQESLLSIDYPLAATAGAHTVSLVAYEPQKLATDYSTVPLDAVYLAGGWAGQGGTWSGTLILQVIPQ